MIPIMKTLSHFRKKLIFNCTCNQTNNSTETCRNDLKLTTDDIRISTTLCIDEGPVLGYKDGDGCWNAGIPWWSWRKSLCDAVPVRDQHRLFHLPTNSGHQRQHWGIMCYNKRTPFVVVINTFFVGLSCSKFICTTKSHHASQCPWPVFVCLMVSFRIKYFA